MQKQPATEGKVLRRARLYDLGLRVITLGRESSMRERMLDQSAVRSGDSVLDVGCGTGTLAIAACKRVGASGQVQGIDPSPTMVSRAQCKADRDHAAARFQIGTIEQIAFPDQTFDLVLSSIMLHHLPDSVKRKGLEEIRRVLKPGGRFFAVDFEPPSYPVFAYLTRLHESSPGLRAMVDTVRGAGLTSVEVGPTGYAMLWYLKAKRDSLTSV
jgi:demethylmenaquinone methyltransferase/2-methoxy-6-polyprenyl-1,4-benzoquinol methylase/phosphoethanolamine N-methyltransferase